jgi:hypothetical protein
MSCQRCTQPTDERGRHRSNGLIVCEPPDQGREMTLQERIEVRHILQELAESVQTFRNAMDPLHGLSNAPVNAFVDNVDNILGPLLRLKERVAERPVSSHSAPAVREDIARQILAQKVECPDHPMPLPKPSCWQCARNGAFHRSALIALGKFTSEDRQRSGER